MAEMWSKTPPTFTTASSRWFWWRTHEGAAPVVLEALSAGGVAVIRRGGELCYHHQVGGEFGPECVLPIASPIECEAVGLDGRTTFCAARRGGSWGQGVEPVAGVFIATALTEGEA